MHPLPEILNGIFYALRSGCSKDRNQIIVDYALHELIRPVGVTTYRLTKELPRGPEYDLPTPEQLEEELEEDA